MFIFLISVVYDHGPSTTQFMKFQLNKTTPNLQSVLKIFNELETTNSNGFEKYQNFKGLDLKQIGYAQKDPNFTNGFRYDVKNIFQCCYIH